MMSHSSRQEAFTEIGLQTAEIVHDLANLVGVLCLELDLLEAGAAAGVVRHDAIQDLSRACGRIQEAAADALASLGPGSGPAQASFSPTKLVRGIIHESLHRFPAVEVTLVADAADTVCVHGPRSLFVRALFNLLRNASRFAWSRISVTVEGGGPDTEWVRISVEDDGPGVPAEEEASLLKPIPRASSEGYGLGLSSALRCARTLGGRLEYRRGEQLGGARFDLVVPVGRTASAERITEPAVDECGELSGSGNPVGDPGWGSVFPSNSFRQIRVQDPG